MPQQQHAAHAVPCASVCVNGTKAYNAHTHTGYGRTHTIAFEWHHLLADERDERDREYGSTERHGACVCATNIGNIANNIQQL